MKGRIFIRGIDRTDDYRIVCPKCNRDMGGTVAPRKGHKINYVECESCKFGSYENFLKQFNAGEVYKGTDDSCETS